MDSHFENLSDFDKEESENEDNWEGDFADEMPVNFYTSLLDRQDYVTDKNETKYEKNEGPVKVMSRMELNDNKAGMQGLDRERINRIIFEASKGSRFFESEQRKEKQVAEKIAVQKEHLKKFTSQQRRDALKETNRIVRELEDSRDLSRSIVHIDMDAFYAAVEMRDNPKLSDIPMAVGSNAMLSTSNYPARKYGVRAAMPGFIAKKLCPQLVIVPLNFDKYRQVSSQVREILAEYDQNFVPMSLDEAYLDLTDYLKRRHENCEVKSFTLKSGARPTTGTGSKGREETSNKTTSENSTSVSNERNLYPDNFEVQNTIYSGSTMQVTDGDGNMESIARDVNDTNIIISSTVKFGCSVEDVVNEIRFRIEQKTQLTASAGIAPNTMLAKICSDKNKPNGQFFLRSDRNSVMSFIKDLPVRKVSGVGRVSEQMLKALGILSCGDLFSKRDILYLLHSPVSFRSLIEISLGLGATHLENDRERKSISTETTFSEINQPWELYNKCMELSHMLAEDVQKENLAGKTVTIKLKTVNFETKTRAVSVPNAISAADEIFAKAKELLENEIKSCLPKPLRLRLMGVRLSNLKQINELRKVVKQETITKMLRRNFRSSDDMSASVQQAHGSEQIQFDNDSRTDKALLCPVCGIQQANSVEINKHLDSCLLDNSNKQLSKLLSSKSNNSGTLHESKRKCHDDDCSSATMLNVLDMENFIEQKNTSFTKFVNKKSETQSYGSGLATKKMICPVCNTLQNLTSDNYLQEFNSHVDLCLNKVEIKKLVSSSEKHCHPSSPRINTSQGKRKRTASQSTVKKLTLDQFWSK